MVENLGMLAMAALAANQVNSFYPSTLQTNDLLTITHYDDYSKLANYAGHGLSTDLDAMDGFSGENNSVYPYARALAKTNQTKGLVTVTRTRILGGANWITSVNIYDENGRVIQVKTYNPDGQVTDIITTQYGFAGQPYITVHKQEIATGSGGAQYFTTRTTTGYDAIGRPNETLKEVAHSSINNGQLSAAKAISKIKYDAIGQVKIKDLGTKPGGSTALETLEYEYNIRGWLLGVNRDYLSSGSTASPQAGKWFGFDLGYNKATNATEAGYITPQYNGNISGQSWRSAGDNVARQYNYYYDEANRLLKANYQQKNSTGAWNSLDMNFDFWTDNSGNGTNGPSYDLNGNIMQMGHRGWRPGKAVWPEANIDILNYGYFPLSNRLREVNDNPNIGPTGLGDFTDNNTSGDDYAYDDNGNLTRDLNKRIGTTASNGIEYNHLNLPKTITVYTETGGLKGTISYTYDAAGSKLKKTVTEGANTTVTLYAGGMVYEQKNSGPVILQFAPHEEGRIRYVPVEGSTPTALHFDYMLKDHLGNVRMVLTEEIKQIVYPAATLEEIGSPGPAVDYERTWYYDINTANVVEKSMADGIPDYNNNNGFDYNHPMLNTDQKMTTASQKLYKLNSTSAKTGLGIAVKVMAGDKLDIFGMSYHDGSTGSTSGLDVPQLLAGFIGAPGSAAAGKLTGVQAEAINPLGSALYSFLQNRPPPASSPKAYINYIFFDEQFKFVSGGCSMVKSSGGWKQHYEELQNIAVPKNGYLYVFCSNETDMNVFFDNLQLIHTQGPMMEETHYYPFGLTMAGISSKAAGKLENKFKYNGIEHNTDFDLNMYDAFYRNLDPQIGRFWQIDPKPNYGESVFSAMSNNPILYSDFLGDTVKYANGAGGDKTRQMVEKFTAKTIINKKGKVVANKHYNEAFANVIGRLDGAVDNFVFNFDANATSGEVSFDGQDVNIRIAEPGDAYGTPNGAEGILFEETKHAEQVLDGKAFFGYNSSGKWGASTNLQNEIEAKLFAADQLGVNRYYTEQSSGSNLQVPTQLGYLKYNAKSEVDKMLFLRNGVQNYSVTGNTGRTGTVNISGAYPTLTGGSVGNTFTQRTKNDKFFGYHPKK